jgi:hypothetical protein
VVIFFCEKKRDFFFFKWPLDLFESVRRMRKATRLTEHHITNLDFTNRIALLESDYQQAQIQLNTLKINAG